MRITITGVKRPPTWIELQYMVQYMLDTGGYFTKIDRDDKGVDYNGLGSYTMLFVPEDPIEIQPISIALTVEGSPS